MADTKTINDTIHGVFRLSGVRRDLLSTPEFNKLSHIKQLGLAHLVFPGAHHTRFEHSLGASHVAGSIADSVGLDPVEKELVEVAAMLHDIGHGPYSHTLEHILHQRGGMDHMSITEGIILGEVDLLSDSDHISPQRRRVCDILDSYGIDPAEVSALIRGPDAGGSERSLFEWIDGAESFSTTDSTLGHIVHGPVDCDQIDYLLRDSHFTGVRHGIIDHHHLINSLVRIGDDLGVGEGGVPALEGMLVARGLMYSAVYFHKVTRVTEVMLSRAVEATDVPALEMQGMVDAEIWRVLAEGPDVSREMLHRLKHRELYKVSRTFRRGDLADNEVSRLLEIAQDDAMCNAVESAIARRVGAKPHQIAIDVPSVKLLLSEPRMAQIDVRVAGDDDQVRWLKEHTPVADALKHRQVSQAACSVICAPSLRADVAKVAPEILFQSSI